jgi:hypothetical protein
MHRVFRAQVGSLGLGYRFFRISSPCRLNNNNVVVPVLSYENSDTEKKAIYQDNYKKLVYTDEPIKNLVKVM